MEILIKDDEDIAKAHQTYQTFNQDDKLRMVHEARMKRQLDYNTAIEEANKNGILQGKTEDAKKMKAKGLSIELISEITGLPEEQIINLKNP